MDNLSCLIFITLIYIAYVLTIENIVFHALRLEVRSEHSSVRTVSESSNERTAKQDVAATISDDKQPTNKEASPFISDKKNLSIDNKSSRSVVLT